MSNVDSAAVQLHNTRMFIARKVLAKAMGATSEASDDEVVSWADLFRSRTGVDAFQRRPDLWALPRSNLDIVRTPLRGDAVRNPFAWFTRSLTFFQKRLDQLDMSLGWGVNMKSAYEAFLKEQFIEGAIGGRDGPKTLWRMFVDNKLILSGLNFFGINLQDQILGRVELPDANFSRAILSGVNMQAADASRAVFDGADLSGARMLATLARGASFVGADLSGANLIHANLMGADLTGAVLDDADMEGVWFDNKMRVTVAQLERAKNAEAIIEAIKNPKPDPSDSGPKGGAGPGKTSLRLVTNEDGASQAGAATDDGFGITGADGLSDLDAGDPLMNGAGAATGFPFVLPVSPVGA